ncbi:ATPase domain-containing protein [Methanolobus mangrovi]|uniref:non-specific serine/threonine protein kinase n=1 Tax=Methanolobus mangrovi TaxID=3072977 RepID=A0AA51UG36_9EURY|nr:ATPase domain-containing protein [Methanolobus mangrovi]WMW21517.1 ATPase domain-containing protein [Methanolobus mangrovi]
MNRLKNISCGVKGLDEILGGMVSPSTILVAGTAGVGKTIMSLQMLSNSSKNGEKALYIPITTESTDKLKMYNSTLDFFDDSFEVHAINRQLAEKDPLTTLIEIGNIIESIKPDRLVIDPITPLGYGFIEQEKRRFFYTLDSMLQERNMLTFLVGELLKTELHNSVVSHLSDGIIYLTREDRNSRADHRMEFIKMRGIDPGIRSEITSRKYLYNVNSAGFTVYPHLKPETELALDDSRVETGVPGLDSMFDGGLLRYNSLLVAGTPGTGKKIFGLQFILQGLENNESGIVITFEDTPHQMILDAKRMGWDLEKYVANGLLHFICNNPSEIYTGEHAANIKEIIETNHIRRVFFDGTNHLELSIPDNLELRGYLYSITSYLKSRNITSLFTTDIAPSECPGNEKIDAAPIMDSVLVLHNSRARDRRYMCVTKSRGTKHKRTVKEYAITESGIKLRIDTLI